MIMGAWVLIFYIWIGNGGASAVVYFETEAACKAAIVELKSTSNSSSFRGGMCLPTGKK